MLELTHNWDAKSYEIGTGYGHVALEVDDAAGACAEVRQRGGRVESSDLVSLAIVVGIAFGGHDDANARPWIPVEVLQFTKFAIDGQVENREQVAAQPHEDRLTFGVAEADVVLQYFWAAGGEHQSAEQHTLKWRAVSFECVYGGDEDMLLDPGERRRVEDIGWRIGAHAAGVRPAVHVESPLVVLDLRQRENRLSIGNREQAALGALEPLFHDELVAGVSEFSFDGDSVDGIVHIFH